MTNSKYEIPALKGLAIHLPLNFNETNEHVKQTLPNFNCLNVIVDSLPTKNNIIWRNLIDINKVVRALKWLKSNNPFYEDIFS